MQKWQKKIFLWDLIFHSRTILQQLHYSLSGFGGKQPEIQLVGNRHYWTISKSWGPLGPMGENNYVMFMGNKVFGIGELLTFWVPCTYNILACTKDHVSVIVPTNCIV